MSTHSSCPFLPKPDEGMNHECLTQLKQGDPAVYYYTALKYGNYLWQEGHAGRAILAVTKALYAELPDSDPIYAEWPLPYAAIQWIVAKHGSDDFPGNPRVSFQHQASRMKSNHSELKRSRAWAVWALICRARPTLKGDELENHREPSHTEIEALLEQHGTAAEVELWKRLLL